jgi:hypothetical protein
MTPIRCGFCLGAKESVAKRGLFSFDAASAKSLQGTEKQNFKRHFRTILQAFRRPFLRFTRGA